jgi:predicted amidophosphoribosyltransferase
MLSLAERLENVQGAFKLKGTGAQVTGKHLLIVDDVMTSGATAHELARELKKLKPKQISLVVMARAIGH